MGRRSLQVECRWAGPSALHNDPAHLHATEEDYGPIEKDLQTCRSLPDRKVPVRNLREKQGHSQFLETVQTCGYHYLSLTTCKCLMVVHNGIRYFAIGSEPYHKQINPGYEFKKIMRSLYLHLSAEAREEMRMSPFGFAFRMFDNNYVFSTHLIHSMLSRRLKTEKKHEMWFAFGGKPLRFSVQEFSAVTGLPCHLPTDSVPEGYGTGLFSEIVTGGKAKISYGNLVDNVLPFCNRYPTADCKRLIYLIIIGGILRPMERRAVILDEFVRIASDLVVCERYPWGRVAFDFLIESVNNAMHKLRQESYSCSGFLPALQYWAMSAIPTLGTAVAKPMACEGPLYLSWTNCRSTSMKKVQEVEYEIVKFDCRVNWSLPLRSGQVVNKYCDEVDDPTAENILRLIDQVDNRLMSVESHMKILATQFDKDSRKRRRATYSSSSDDSLQILLEEKENQEKEEEEAKEKQVLQLLDDDEEEVEEKKTWEEKENQLAVFKKKATCNI
ncbi:PREDICTED: uncharacterized protein LOC104815450 [Tarenaya hassleriana]|uniref:uncharacterized protein LOC104815450 n=1 Tax=Tarenaya hassleriana TaxID=28532 RepID=UPI00053C2A40|nr:PREDICTED: uncharacterized protein LOC104815450 [Tarenaya hassleriana]